MVYRTRSCSISSTVELTVCLVMIFEFHSFDVACESVDCRLDKSQRKYEPKVENKEPYRYKLGHNPLQQGSAKVVYHTLVYPGC